MTYQGQPAYFLRDPQWVTGLGLVGRVFYNNAKGYVSDGYFCVVSFDGKAQTRNDNPSGLVGGDFSLDLEEDELINMGLGSGELLRYSPITVAFKENLTPTGILNGTKMARLPDRNLFVWFGAIRSVASSTNNINDASLVVEASLPVSEQYPQSYSKGPQGTLYISSGDGRLYQYNTQSKALMGHPTGLGMACKGCWYIAEHNIFISIHNITGSSQQELRIWANETAPASLSNPVALNPLLKGKVTQIEVQLLGDYSEPVEGVLVDWTLTGDGALSPLQSRTDSQGKARTKYIAPLDSLPTITVQASLTL
jgi:hypothetical protein